MKQWARTRRTRRIGTLGTFLLPFLLLGGPLVMPASAHTGHHDIRFRNCHVEMLQPRGGVNNGTVVADTVLVGRGGCLARTTSAWICWDVMYLTNTSRWTSWRNASKGDPFKHSNNGCARGYQPNRDGFSSFSLAQSLRPSSCSDFRAVKMRASAWVVKGGRASAIHRSDLTKTWFC